MEFINVNIVPGLVIGCIYAIAASGLVVAFNTSGVLNLGYGAVAYTIALIFYELRAANDIMSGWAAFLLCVFVLGPVIGILLWQLLFRWLVDLGLLPTLIASIGVAVALPALCLMIFTPGQVFYAPGVSDNGVSLKQIGDMYFTTDQAWAVAAAVVVGVSLVWLLRFTSLGLQMRAVTDSRRVAGLTGISPSLMSNVSWAISGALAAVGGVFLAPVLALSPTAFLSLTVASLAAALVGGLRSIAITFGAALVLGVTSSAIVGLNSSNSLLSKGIQPSLPFLVMLAVVLLRRSPIDVGQASRATADYAERLDPLRRQAIKVLPSMAIILVLPLFLNAYWTGVFGLGLVYAVIFLGFTFSLGYGGLLPLGQAALVGIGAFAAGGLAAEKDVPLLLALLLGAIVAMLVGAAIALVGARLSSLEFGLLTIAFGLFADHFLFNWATLVPIDGRPFGDPYLLGFDLASAEQQYYLFAAVLLMVLLFVNWFRRRLGALTVSAARMRPAVASATGIDPRVGRLVTFSLAAFIAGLGGGLLGVYQKHLGATDLTTAIGLTWLAVVVFMGIRSAAAAVIGGLVFAVFPALISEWLPIKWGPLATVLFGLGALSLAQNPRGAVAAQMDQFAWVSAKVKPLFGRS